MNISSWGLYCSFSHQGLNSFITTCLGWVRRDWQSPAESMSQVCPSICVCRLELCLYPSSWLHHMGPWLFMAKAWKCWDSFHALSFLDFGEETQLYSFSVLLFKGLGPLPDWSRRQQSSSSIWLAAGLWTGSCKFRNSIWLVAGLTTALWEGRRLAVRVQGRGQNWELWRQYLSQHSGGIKVS